MPFSDLGQEGERRGWKAAAIEGGKNKSKAEVASASK